MQTLVVIFIITSSIASQYSPGVMQEVITNRQSGNAWVMLPTDTPSVHGYIAVLDCEHLGETWLLRPEGKEVWESFWVVDCAGDERTRQWMLDNNITVELDHETAHRWGYPGIGVPIERLQYVTVEGGSGLTQ